MISSFSFPKKGKKITKNRICKTWFVGQAFEIRESGKKRDNSNRARGSKFIFNTDNTFKLIDKSRSYKKVEEGNYILFGKDSMVLEMGSQVLRFKLTLVKKDSLTLTTSRRSGHKMIIGMSLDSITPFKEEYTYEPAESEVVEIEQEEITVEDYDAVKVPEPEEIPVSPQEIRSKKSFSTYELTGQWQAIDSSNLSITLNYNHYSILKLENKTLNGSWSVSYRTIRLSNEKGDIYYKIKNKTENKMEIMDLSTSKTIQLKKKTL